LHAGGGKERSRTQEGSQKNGVTCTDRGGDNNVRKVNVRQSDCDFLWGNERRKKNETIFTNAGLEMPGLTKIEGVN